MDVDVNRRNRRTVTLAGLSAIVVIAAVLATMTWSFGRPAGVSSRPAVTSSGGTLGAGSSQPSPAGTSAGGSTGSSRSGSSPAGTSRISAADLTGQWDSTLGVTVTFAADGTWSTIGGCNTGIGTWRVAPGGAFTLAITRRTRLPCPLTAGSDGVPAGDMMLGFLQSTSRVAAGTTSGPPSIALIDRYGTDLARLVRHVQTTGPARASRPPALAG